MSRKTVNVHVHTHTYIPEDTQKVCMKVCIRANRIINRDTNLYTHTHTLIHMCVCVYKGSESEVAKYDDQNEIPLKGLNIDLKLKKNLQA